MIQIFAFRLKGSENIENKASEVGLDAMSTSFITLSELYYGAYKSQRKDKNIHNIGKLKEKLFVVESNDLICEMFGKIKVALINKGNIIDDADIFIAACALIEDAILVTNNEKHFQRIDELRLENWSNI